MFRLKQCFGDRLKNRTPANQATEVALRCKLLNHCVSLDMPDFLWSGWSIKPY